MTRRVREDAGLAGRVVITATLAQIPVIGWCTWRESNPLLCGPEFRDIGFGLTVSYSLSAAERHRFSPLFAPTVVRLGPALTSCSSLVGARHGPDAVSPNRD